MATNVPNYIEGKIAENLITDYVTIKSFREIISTNPVRTPHYHALLYQVCWVSKGDYFITVEDQDHHLKKNCLFLIKPGTVHYESHHSEDLEGYVIHFSHDFFALYASVNRFFSQIIKKGHPNLTITTNMNETAATEINRMFHEMKERYMGDSLFKNDVLKSYINTLLLKMYELHHLTDNNSINSSGAIYSRFLQLLDQHFQTKNKVHEYAEMLNVSSGYLNKITKNETRKKAGDIIRERIIMEAQRSLIYTDHSISEISYRFNFNDCSYFWKVFKKHVGYSPKEYRDKYR